jgi:hypothetical protein
MKQHFVNVINDMKAINLTQQQIDTIYFTAKNFIKHTADVDSLYELTDLQKVDYKNELEILEIFSKL